MARALLTAVVLSLLVGAAAGAQEAPSGIKRTPLQKVDFPEGHTTVTGLAEIAPGASAGRHTHPGIETGYVLEGTTILSIDGQPDLVLEAGQSYLIPAGAVHDARPGGDQPVKVLGVYIIERGKPLASPAQ